MIPKSLDKDDTLTLIINDYLPARNLKFQSLRLKYLHLFDLLNFL